MINCRWTMGNLQKYSTGILILTFCVVSGYAQNDIEKLFYYVDHPSSFNSLVTHIREITVIAPQSFKIDAKGNISGSVDERVIELATTHNVDILPLIVNPGFDQQLIHAVLEDSLARRRAIKNMYELCKENKFIGLQFDFEHICVKYKEAFTQFFQQAARILHAEGFLISAAVFPRTGDTPAPSNYHTWYFENWTGVFDYKALAEASDFLTIMTYDQHSEKTPPGPVAGIPWIEKVLQYILKQVPAYKISLGIPLYSYHWYAGVDEKGGRMAGRGLAYGEAKDLLRNHQAAMHWNDEQKVYYSFFASQSIFEYLFIENAHSFQAKLDLVRKHNLRGFSSWRLGLEDVEIWPVLVVD